MPSLPPFRVLVVCTANHCRSPIIEHVMRGSAVLGEAGWAVVSAGTRAVDGAPMHPLAEEVLIDHGYDTDGWRSRALTSTLVRGADLILAADGETRREVVTLEPQGLPRTFVLGQFARLAELAAAVHRGVPQAMGAQVIEAVVQARLSSRGYDPGDDLVDPVGRRLRHFRDTFATVARDVQRIEVPLAAAASGPHSDGVRAGSPKS